MSKIGIMGGTFDPIHNGHLKIAHAAHSEYHLDKVIFLTSGNPPHKKDRKILDATIRHIMVKRAIEGTEYFEACDWEVKRSEYSYTLTTLQHFKTIYPDDEIFFIIGGDSLRDFHKWYNPEEILKLATLLVYDRQGGKISSSFAKVIHGGKIDISSTKIREMVANNEDISELVPKSVSDFIKRNRLYKNELDLEAKLKKMLKPERFIHSLGVRDTAVKMAEIFGADTEKARIAGLLHDNAKNMDNLYERCRDLEIELDELETENIGLVHAKLGAETAKCEFGITDSEILNAIRWHTLGKPDMSLLEKIVFIADLVEPGRNFPDLKRLRQLAFSDIDKALLECVKSTIQVNIKRNSPVHPNAYSIVEELEKKLTKLL